MIRDRRSIALFELCLIYVLARFWRLTDSCLWFDEIFSVHAAEHDWSSILWFVAQDLIHPPLFYILLKVWIGVGGESLIWLRLLPVLFACAALFPLVKLGRELKLRTSTILFAIYLLAVNGSLINYTQRLRMYTLLMCLSLFSIWLFVRYFNRGKNLIALAIVNSFLIYTHYYGWLVVACEVAVILALQRMKWRGATTLVATSAVAFLPWIWAILSARQNGSELRQNIAWITKPGLSEIGTFVIDLVEPFYFQFSNTEPASIYAISIPVLLVFVSAKVIFFTRIRSYEKTERRGIMLLAIFALLPLIGAFTASWIFPYSVWGARHLIVCAGPLALLAAEIVMRLESRVVQISAMTLIVLFSIAGFVLQATRPRTVYLWCAWDEIGNQFAADADDQNTKVYAFESLIAYHIWFATRNAPNIEVSDVTGFGEAPEKEIYFLPRGFDGIQRKEIKDISGDKIWLVFRTQKIGEESGLFETLKQRGYSTCPSMPIRHSMTNVFKIEMVKPPALCSP